MLLKRWLFQIASVQNGTVLFNFVCFGSGSIGRGTKGATIFRQIDAMFNGVDASEILALYIRKESKHLFDAVEIFFVYFQER